MTSPQVRHIMVQRSITRLLCTNSLLARWSRRFGRQGHGFNAGRSRIRVSGPGKPHAMGRPMTVCVAAICTLERGAPNDCWRVRQNASARTSSTNLRRGKPTTSSLGSLRWSLAILTRKSQFATEPLTSSLKSPLKR